LALKFGDSHGSAIKTKLETFTYQFGENKFRIVGDILPRYVYWLKGDNDKDIPVESLDFNRDTETFDNIEKNWVEEYFPDQTCSWNYVTQCITEDGRLVVLNLKKKFWEQVITASEDEDLGDPTDIETGWSVVVKKEKTGPMNYNVSYTVLVMKCLKTKGPLTEAESELIKDIKSMDELMPRPTPEAQKKFLDRLTNRAASNTSEEADEETIEKEFQTRLE